MAYHAGGAGRPHPVQTAFPGCQTNREGRTRRREERNASALSERRRPRSSVKGPRKTSSDGGIRPEYPATDLYIRRERVLLRETDFVFRFLGVRKLCLTKAARVAFVFDDANHSLGVVAYVMLKTRGGASRKRKNMVISTPRRCFFLVSIRTHNTNSRRTKPAPTGVYPTSCNYTRTQAR